MERIRIFYDIICKNFFNCNLLNNDKILVLPFGGGEDIESFINIDYFDTSQRDLFLIIDSDKHLNKQDEQQKRIDDFNKKEKGKGYKLNKSCIENYYHPRAIERVYNLPQNTFNSFKEDDNAREIIKEIVKDKSLANIKEKNNIKVFKETNKIEWDEIVEPELIDFLSEIIWTLSD
jgi:putative ATP-dependent endonuclease of OLD family